MSEKKTDLKSAKEARELTREQLEVALEEEKEPLREELGQLERDVRSKKAAVEAAKTVQAAVMEKIFATAGNFLRGEGKAPFDKIVA